MLAGLLFIGATPAQAAPPTDTQNFYPDDTPKANTVGVNLSDRFDGVNTSAHLTTVAPATTERVQWRLCPVGTVATTGNDTLTQAQFNSCTIIIGEDTSPTTPVGDPPAGVDEAYEFAWDIPGSEDGATRDLVAAACIGAGQDVEDDAVPAGDERNCALDIENDVLLDDTQTAVPQTSSGEIVSLCTSDVGGPLPGPTGDLCVRGEGGTNAEVDARFVPFGHGSNVPNDGFTMRISTSDDITDPIGLVNIGDAETDPNTPQDGTPTCTLIFTGTNFKTWECTAVDTDVPDDEELALTVIRNFGGGTGNCAASFCEFDSHYVVSNERRAVSVVSTFENPELTLEENCAAPSDAATNNLGDFETVLFCVTDQFGQPLDTGVTFESSGPTSAGFEPSECTEMNHDASADGVDEHCDGATGPDGIAEAEITNPDEFNAGEAATPGVQVVTACVEGEPAPADPAHGCADEPAALQDTVSKTWETVANELVLVIGDKTTDCFTGPTFAQMEDNDTINVLACVFDDFGNPTSTTGADDGFLEWSIDSGADDDVDTQYESAPAETDAEGEAVAVVEGISLGTDFPTVCLRENGTGNFLSCDSVQLNVTEDTDPGKENSKVGITHRKGPHRFKGRVTSPDPTCEPGRTVVVKRRRPGADKSIGSDVTNAAGKYVVPHSKTGKKKTYYAKVNGNADCRFDLSKNIRRR